jgi:hypothetical protein
MTAGRPIQPMTYSEPPPIRDFVPCALLLAVLCLVLLPQSSPAQFYRTANHPELIWHTLETDHFKIHYHDGIEGFARRAAVAAEEAYGPVTSFYEFEPDDKVRLTLRDTDDQGFGASYYYDNAMEIWATSINIDFELRGTKTDWLRNVVTHEFVHMISLQTARKGPRRVLPWIRVSERGSAR